MMFALHPEHELYAPVYVLNVKKIIQGFADV